MTEVNANDSGGKDQRRRFDLVMEVVSSNGETGEIQLLLKPDPRRYEWRDRVGERRLYDRFDDVYFAPEVWQQFAAQLPNVPMTFEAPRISDAGEYVRGRRAAVAAMLGGTPAAASFADKSEEFLQALAGDELGFVVVCIDIVDSTSLATSEHGDVYRRRVVPTLLFELSEIVPLFNGHVLKYTGDGLIAYFPEPSFMHKNDLALDCALTMHLTCSRRPERRTEGTRMARA